ncbi:MAG: transcriptional repressor LexA [Deltaproteobacteria bacterium]|jgi:repressor LexA|nr:transcriptional repressor LexA [Deltaproteobacteria bacterium]MDH4007048.1 transcriptional repressor LexA [Desulfuromonadales bacterium]
MSQLTTRQQQVYDFLAGYIADQGYPPTLQEIAGHLQVSGNFGVLRHLQVLERKGLINRSPGSSRSIVLADRSRSEPLDLPLVGTVQAGLPQLAEEQIETYLAVDSSLVKGKGSFLLRVRGESMIDAHIMPGDLVVVRPQPSAESGEIVVALIDDEATLKRFYREGEEIRLKPENARMKSLIYRERDAQVQIIGKVTGLCRPLG